MSKETMVTLYKRHAAAHTYLVGFIRNGKLYATMYVDMIADELLKLERAAKSKGGMLKIRVRFSATQMEKLIRSGKAVEIGPESLMAPDGKYNAGERFERVITELFTHTTWTKDKVPFYEAGDIRLNGVEVQVKFNGAELTNERTLARLIESLA